MNTVVEMVGGSLRFFNDFAKFAAQLKYLNAKYCEELTGVARVEQILTSCSRLRVLIASVRSMTEAEQLNQSYGTQKNIELVLSYKR